MIEKDKVQMRKRNMKLFPIYRMLGWDYIFFYTTNFLFLTQVKGIHPADVVLIDSFYALFGIIMQVPATFIIEYLGRKRSMILANFCNCIYMLVVMFSTNLFNLITAELLSSLAFGIKETVDPALLNESIPPSRYKSKIFAKISQKGMANYYIMNAIATVLAGFFYDINPYIPITLSLIITILVTMISTRFIEPQNEKKKHKVQEFNQLKEIKDSFKFILKSERLKALILFSAISGGVISLMSTYEVSLLEDFDISIKLNPNIVRRLWNNSVSVVFIYFGSLPSRLRPENATICPRALNIGNINLSRKKSYIPYSPRRHNPVASKLSCFIFTNVFAIMLFFGAYPIRYFFIISSLNPRRRIYSSACAPFSSNSFF